MRHDDDDDDDVPFVSLESLWPGIWQT